MRLVMFLFIGWFTLEYLNVMSAIVRNRCFQSMPMAWSIGALYDRLHERSRWTRHLDPRGSLAYITLLNLTTALFGLFWNADAAVSYWLAGLLSAGVILQLIENLAWSWHGLEPMFHSWSNHIKMIRGTSGFPSEKEDLRTAIETFTLAQLLPSLLGRIVLTAILVSILFAGLYQQVLVVSPDAFVDSENTSLLGNYLSLFAYSVEDTVSGRSAMKAVNGLGRLVCAFHRASNIFLFSLFIGNIIVMAREDIEQRKRNLLKELDTIGK